ncbi:hypothetical protein KC640_00025 [Candidatus Dojkabacteria bacterium]|uniref:Thioredoxin domain-containing protein n=1 Tax=Candidatus Dojkabacteria bacterium TaxID=2099670 RepID=A0A955I6M9_9BACT|nr:hypothetical protein [Candidatus Dojkabacteria bacterium]
MAGKYMQAQRLVVAGILLVATVFVGGLLYIYNYHSGELSGLDDFSRANESTTEPALLAPVPETEITTVSRIVLITTNWSSSGVKMQEMLAEFGENHPEIVCEEYDAATNQAIVSYYQIASFPTVVVENDSGEYIVMEALTISDFSAYLARLD